jgi:predicted  nucleic acid-binding Zn-ribbon protein
MAVRIPGDSDAQKHLVALQQRWKATNREVIALRQESADLRRLLRDVMKLRQEQEQPLQSLGERLVALADAKGIKQLIGELDISASSYHRLRKGGASSRMRAKVEAGLSESGGSISLASE